MNEDDLDRMISAWTSEHMAEEVMATMQTAGVAAGIVEKAQDLLERDFQLKHRGFFLDGGNNRIGRSLRYGWPVKL